MLNVACQYCSQSGQAGEFHPNLPTEPCVKVSLHTALRIDKSQKYFYFIGYVQQEMQNYAYSLVVILFHNNKSSLLRL
jgi:hypothetical protein